ncbi:MAG TPA: dihydrolipoamide acetyltransferase family protein [Herpetosiphonaceae bacterium]|nr:dihydrolipoamide acetyltransferase family protein [Herpetosiphonaceae bacterium]
MPLEFKMPKLGESVTEGTVGRWLKQPGDAVEQYEPMLEVTTDKVDTEVPSPVTGTISQILVAEGDTVPVGTVIAVLLESDEAAGDAQGVPAASPAAALREDEPRPAASANGGSPAGFLSPVVARLISEHNLDASQIKGTGREGRVTKQDVQRFVAERDLAQRQAARPAPMPMPAPNPPAPAAMPMVGPSGTPAPMPTIRSQDSEVRIQEPPLPAFARPVAAAAPAPIQSLAAGDEVVPLNGMRRAIAEHMVRSKRTAPHVTTVMEADLSAVVAHRERNKGEFERQGVKLTFTPYFVLATVAALRAVPIVNASFTDEGILMHGVVNVGMAVAIPDGLIVPVIRDADDKSLLGLSRTVNDLAERARSRRLTADEVSGGTFTITNHGVGGSLFAMPIINQPQSGILGIGAMQKRPVVVTQNGMDAIAIRPMCYLSLTFDHRIIDGATADQFLMHIKRGLEQFSS